MTMEYQAGHYMKRLTMIDLLFGDADHHLRALARGGGLFATMTLPPRSPERRITWRSDGSGP